MDDFAKSEKTRYWLKLDKNFFKSPHIKIIKSMPNGLHYVVFYLSLMLESVESVGHLKFTDLIPYDANMLAVLTDTNVDIVRGAMELFQSLGLMEVLDDGTIFMTQVSLMTGTRSESADRVQRFRERKKSNLALHVTKSNDIKEKEKEKDINKQENKQIDKQIDTFEHLTNARVTGNDNFSPAISNKTKKLDKAESEELFERLWKLYPRKKGKGAVKPAGKKRLLKHGYAVIAAAIENYKREIESENIDDQYIMFGSTFFNTRYVDYITADISADETEKECVKDDFVVF